MFSSLSNYIWGAEAEMQPDKDESPAVASKAADCPRDESVGAEDWVMVGGEQAEPSPSQSSQPSLATEALASNGADRPVEPTKQKGNHTSLGQLVTKKQFQAVKSAQLAKRKISASSMSNKALKKSNKTVFANGNKKRQVSKQNLNIKMAGKKTLKQC